MKKILCISLSPDVVRTATAQPAGVVQHPGVPRRVRHRGQRLRGRITNRAIAMGTQGASVLERSRSVWKTGTLGPAVLRARPAKERGTWEAATTADIWFSMYVALANDSPPWRAARR